MTKMVDCMDDLWQ